MSKLKRVLTALAVVFCCGAVWAGLPTITVNGNDVTISSDSGSHGNIGTNNGGYDTLTIPAATDLDSGTVLLIKSISLGARTNGTAAPASVVLAGVSSAAAEVTTSGYTDRDKYTYVFKTPCLMKVGTGSTISFRNAAGEQENVGLAASLTASTDQDDYLFTTLRSTSGNNKWSVLTEIVAEKVTGYINQTADGFNTTVTAEKVYVSGVTGYLNTVDAFGFGNVDELVVVDGAYTYGYKVVNGNSPQNNDTKCNRAVAFKKLSGTGTITNGDHGNGPTPVMGVCDSSEFAGSINIGSATTRLSVLFCTEAEISAGIGTSLGANLYSLFTSETGRSRIYVSPGRTTANNAVVTVPAGKTWTAVNGIENRGELVVDGTVSCNIVNSGTLTVNGAVTGTISGSGAVVVNEGATVPSFGSQRDFTGWTVDSSVPVKITMTAEEYGKGSVSVTGANGISSITVLAPDGTTEVTTLTPENGEAAYERGSVLVSGKACWYAWEMNGNLNGSGVNTAGLSHDTGSSDQNAFYNSSMLYTYRHPYTSVAFPATWTAVVRCTVPKVVNGTVITFGTKFTSFIGLIAGDDPEKEMKLVRYNYNDEAYTVLASMPIVDGTSAQHVYIFSVENNSTVKVYCDGSVVLDQTFDAFSLGGGIQIGSAHGGVAGGLVRMWAGDTYAGLTTDDLEEARIDCVRLYDYSLSAEQVAALSTEFPSVTIYRATVEDEADTTWGDLSWEPSWTGGNSLSKVILTTEGDATVALPETITADQLQFVLAADSTLTLAGPGSLTVTEPVDIGNGTLELTGTVTLTQDTTFNGKVKFTQFTKAGDGDIQLANGATVGVDAALVVTPLGNYTCAEGTVVDSSCEGDGVKLMPLTSAKISVTQSGTTLYYSDHEAVLVSMLQTPEAFAEDTVATLLNDATIPSGFDTYLQMYGYYIDGVAITKAVAQISSFTYPTLAAAVTAAADGATVQLLRASSEEITLSDKAITLRETANFSGTLTGNGTLTFYAFRNNPSITFDNWTGTVVLPEFEAAGTILNKYGVTGSTVVLKGITAGWLGETSTQVMNVDPVLQLDGDVTIKGFSTSWDYTFTEITGEGNFSLDPTDNSPKSATITTVAKDFTGIITNNTTKTITIGTLARQAEQTTTPGTKLLDVGGTGEIVASALTVGGEASEVEMITKADGIYVLTYYTITVVAPNATVAGVGETVSEATPTVQFTVTPDADYKVTSVTVGEDAVVADGEGKYSYTFDGPATITVATALDEVTFTLPVVTGAKVVDVTGGTWDEMNGTITAIVGHTVTLTWDADGAYVVSGTKSQTIAVTDGMTTAPEPAAEVVTPTAAVAQDSEGTYYSNEMQGIGWLLSHINNEGAYVQILGDATGSNIYGGYGVAYDASTKQYVKSVAIIVVQGDQTPGYRTVQAALDVATDGQTVKLQANCAEELVLTNGAEARTVTIDANGSGQVVYTYTAPEAADNTYTVVAGETENNKTPYTARNWYTWTVTVDAEHATVTGIEDGDEVSESDPDITFTVAPAATYKVTAVKVGDETLVGDNGSYSYTVTGNATVTVETELDVVTFTVPALANATVTEVTGATPTGNANEYTATIGDAVTVTYTANDGYVFAGGATTTTVNWTAAAAAAPTAPASAPVVAVAKIGNTPYETLAAVLAAVSGATGEVTVELLANVALEISRYGNVLGGDAVTKITINGNGNTINFVRNGTWAQVNTANGASLVLNDVNLTSEFTGTMTEWQSEPLQNPNHNIAFNCAVALNNVTSSTALSFFKDAALDTVTISETVDVYSIWIHTTASTVAIKDLVVYSPAGRGIKVDDSFVAGWGGTPSATSISINGATFTTKNRKAAVLVRSICATTVAATGTIDITGVPADTTNLVWVDEASATKFDLVTVTGATVAVEPGSYVATVSDGNAVKGYYTTVTAALEAAETGDTVTLLADVTLDARVEPSKSMTIDLGGYTITRTGTSGNGSVFDVKSGTVTIKNGEIDCTQDDTAIVANGVYAITARSGANVTLSGLTVKVDSECGACAYPFDGGSITILDGTYANTTTTPYRYKTAWTGMAVNQANVSTQLITIYGGSFKQVNPELGDDSWADGAGTFLADGYIAVESDGVYTVKQGVWVAQVTGGAKFESLADAVAAATAGDTVTLLANVTLDARVEPNLGADTTLTIDLGGKKITRTGTGGNGSVFDVKSGTVTIKNGTIDCTQDDTAIVADGVYAITARSGSAVTLEDLTITVDSQAGACACPFAGATITILSGAYVNTTEDAYQYHAGWTGMAVNQHNGCGSTQSIFIKGGTFSQVNPDLGDDSWANGAGTFLAVGYKATETSTGVWTVQVQTVDPNATEGDPEVIVVPATATDEEVAEAVEEMPVTPTTAVATDWENKGVVVEPETYTSYFTKTVERTGGTTANVTIELNDAVVMPALIETQMATALDAVLDETTNPAAEGEVTLPATATKPGLYYSIEVCEDLSFADATVGDSTLATGAAIAVERPALSTTSGIWFYRVKVSATP